MPLLDELRSDGAILLCEIEEFRAFLAAKPRGERTDFLPFFSAHRQLCAHLGTMHDRVSIGTHVRAELSLWGDFICDLVAGSVQAAAFVFFEFEDASPTSLFRRRRGRKNSYWGARVERGISQVTDWLFRIGSEGPSDRMERDFGARHIVPMAVVVVGRRSEVSPYDRIRLDWRSAHSIIGGAKLSILTYDDPLDWLDGRVALLRSHGEAPFSTR
jgi:hypothetical protein